MSDTCVPDHDWVTATLTTILCIGLVVSYLPQHYRIIKNKSSVGLSPWFLLLGSTGCASGLYNMLALQWDKVKCCRVLSTSTCLEMTGGISQLWLMWFLFTLILVLYIIYYPPHLKYVIVPVDVDDEVEVNDSAFQSPVKYIQTDDWRLSIILAWVVAIHFVVLTIVTFSLLLTTPPDAAVSPSSLLSSSTPQGSDIRIQRWATFLGVSSAALTTLQYAPQLYRTYHAKLVGALSIPMMLIQTPGTVFMVLSIALRSGTNWTSWIMFAVSGVMQGSLLIMCIAWTFRQRSLGIDDFGRPLPDANMFVSSPEPILVIALEVEEGPVTEREETMEVGEDTPLLTTNRKRRNWVGRWLRIPSRLVRRSGDGQ